MRVSRLPSLIEELVLAAQAVCPDLRLAGGAGLALLLEHRRSDDIDLFCSNSEDVEIVRRAQIRQWMLVIALSSGL
jgi:hypothetical protein